jgi:hypothetical protein
MSGVLGLFVRLALVMTNQPEANSESAPFLFSPIVEDGTVPLTLLTLDLVLLSLAIAAAKLPVGLIGALAMLVVVMVSKLDHVTSVSLLQVMVWHVPHSSKQGIATWIAPIV